jgi:branched-chain amino acid transport system substrate-binding protein
MSLRTLAGMLLGVAITFVPGMAHAADIVIAQTVPLTGVAAESGNGLVLGTKIYFDHINSAGGVNGQKIVHIVKDDGYTIENTVKNTKDFIADPRIIALTGFYGTDNVTELLKQGLFDKTPLSIVGVSSGARLLREPLNPHIFHIRASYAEEIEVLVQHMAGLGTKRVAVFYEENPFGEAGLRAAEDAVKKRNLILVARATYEPHTTDVVNAVKDVLASNADAVIMISIAQPAAAFMKRFRAGGGRGLLFSISTATLDGLLKAADSPVQLQGLGISQVLPFPYRATLPVVSEYQALMEKYAPKDTPYSYSSMEGFLNAKVLVAALKKAGPKPTRASVNKALANLGEYDTGGYPVTFSPTNHVGSKFVELTVISKTGVLMR